MPAERLDAVPTAAPELDSRVARYEQAVAQLRARGCRCPLHCVITRGEVAAVPLNAVLADACPADHAPPRAARHDP